MQTHLRDRGQAGVSLLVVTAVLFVSLAVALTAVGGRMIDRTRAQSVADAAALASLVGGPDAAATLVQRHGATLVSVTVGPASGQVTVVVRVGEVTATAAASDDP